MSASGQELAVSETSMLVVSTAFNQLPDLGDRSDMVPSPLSINVRNRSNVGAVLDTASALFFHLYFDFYFDQDYLSKI